MNITDKLAKALAPFAEDKFVSGHQMVEAISAAREALEDYAEKCLSEPTGEVYALDLTSILAVPNDRGQRDRLLIDLPGAVSEVEAAKARAPLPVRFGPMKWTDDGEPRTRAFLTLGKLRIKEL